MRFIPSMRSTFPICAILVATAFANLFGADEGSASPTAPETLLTNGPAVFKAQVVAPPVLSLSNSGAGPTPAARSRPQTNLVFEGFLPESLNNRIWTNLLALTNGRSTEIWSVRSHPIGWPLKAPVVQWNPKSLLFGMKGFTGLSPCWEDERASGQIPVTALTRRHGYTRGHGMGPDGFNNNWAGKKVWFVTENNKVVQATISHACVRNFSGTTHQDYTLFFFKDELPPSIQPLRVVASTNLNAKYPGRGTAPRPVFKTEQAGNVSADIPGFTVNTWKGGDSGSPDMLPLPGELVFSGGRSTSNPCAQMQADMDELCRLEKVKASKYQMQWVDLKEFPSY